MFRRDRYCPEIAPDVNPLYVFQRTPAWVIPRDERRYPGIEKWGFSIIPGLRALHRARLYWTNESRLWSILNPAISKSLSTLAKAFIQLQIKDSNIAVWPKSTWKYWLETLTVKTSDYELNYKKDHYNKERSTRRVLSENL